MNKKFFFKCGLLLILIGVFVAIPFHFDTFNVFHWQNRRFTVAEPNRNYVKTQYVIHNPKKFNAFIFGSSRVGNIPPDNLPATAEGTPLHWYNMTYSEGIPAEHLLSMQTFWEHGVNIKIILLGFDNIPMYASVEQHKNQLLRMPSQVYEENKTSFLRPYLQNFPSLSIIKEIIGYKTSEHAEDSDLFYEYGVGKNNIDFSLGENPDMSRFASNHPKLGYTQKNAQDDIAAITEFCREHDIKLILFTNPIYETTYRDAVGDGYFDFLRKVSEKCEFYNFSSLNDFTTDPRYYFESSHYRPALGRLVEKMLFGTEEEREQIRAEAGDELWGERVNVENIDFVISELRKQIDAREH